MTDPTAAAIERIQRLVNHAALVAVVEIQQMTARAVRHINRSAGQYARRQREQRPHRRKK